MCTTKTFSTKVPRGPRLMYKSISLLLALVVVAGYLVQASVAGRSGRHRNRVQQNSNQMARHQPMVPVPVPVPVMQPVIYAPVGYYPPPSPMMPTVPQQSLNERMPAHSKKRKHRHHFHRHQKHQVQQQNQQPRGSRRYKDRKKNHRNDNARQRQSEQEHQMQKERELQKQQRVQEQKQQEQANRKQNTKKGIHVGRKPSARESKKNKKELNKMKAQLAETEKRLAEMSKLVSNMNNNKSKSDEHKSDNSDNKKQSRPSKKRSRRKKVKLAKKLPKKSQASQDNNDQTLDAPPTLSKQGEPASSMKQPPVQVKDDKIVGDTPTNEPPKLASVNEHIGEAEPASASALEDPPTLKTPVRSEAPPIAPEDIDQSPREEIVQTPSEKDLPKPPIDMDKLKNDISEAATDVKNRMQPHIDNLRNSILGRPDDPSLVFTDDNDEVSSPNKDTPLDDPVGDQSEGDPSSPSDHDQTNSDDLSDDASSSAAAPPADRESGESPNAPTDVGSPVENPHPNDDPQSIEPPGPPSRFDKMKDRLNNAVDNAKDKVKPHLNNLRDKISDHLPSKHGPGDPDTPNDDDDSAKNGIVDQPDILGDDLEEQSDESPGPYEDPQPTLSDRDDSIQLDPPLDDGSEEQPTKPSISDPDMDLNHSTPADTLDPIDKDVASEALDKNDPVSPEITPPSTREDQELSSVSPPVVEPGFTNSEDDVTHPEKVSNADLVPEQSEPLDSTDDDVTLGPSDPSDPLPNTADHSTPHPADDYEPLAVDPTVTDPTHSVFDDRADSTGIPEDSVPEPSKNPTHPLDDDVALEGSDENDPSPEISSSSPSSDHEPSLISPPDTKSVRPGSETSLDPEEDDEVQSELRNPEDPIPDVDEGVSEPQVPLLDDDISLPPMHDDDLNPQLESIVEPEAPLSDAPAVSDQPPISDSESVSDPADDIVDPIMPEPDSLAAVMDDVDIPTDEYPNGASSAPLPEPSAVPDKIGEEPIIEPSVAPESELPVEPILDPDDPKIPSDLDDQPSVSPHDSALLPDEESVYSPPQSSTHPSVAIDPDDRDPDVMPDDPELNAHPSDIDEPVPELIASKLDPHDVISQTDIELTDDEPIAQTNDGLAETPTVPFSGFTPKPKNDPSKSISSWLPEKPNLDDPLLDPIDEPSIGPPIDSPLEDDVDIAVSPPASSIVDPDVTSPEQPHVSEHVPEPIAILDPTHDHSIIPENPIDPSIVPDILDDDPLIEPSITPSFVPNGPHSSAPADPDAVDADISTPYQDALPEGSVTDSTLDALPDSAHDLSVLPDDVAIPPIPSQSLHEPSVMPTPSIPSSNHLPSALPDASIPESTHTPSVVPQPSIPDAIHTPNVPNLSHLPSITPTPSVPSSDHVPSVAPEPSHVPPIPTIPNPSYIPSMHDPSIVPSPSVPSIGSEPSSLNPIHSPSVNPAPSVVPPLNMPDSTHVPSAEPEPSVMPAPSIPESIHTPSVVPEPSHVPTVLPINGDDDDPVITSSLAPDSHTPSSSNRPVQPSIVSPPVPSAPSHESDGVTSNFNPPQPSLGPDLDDIVDEGDDEPNAISDERSIPVHPNILDPRQLPTKDSLIDPHVPTVLPDEQSIHSSLPSPSFTRPRTVVEPHFPDSVVNPASPMPSVIPPPAIINDHPSVYPQPSAVVDPTPSVIGPGTTLDITPPVTIMPEPSAVVVPQPTTSVLPDLPVAPDTFGPVIDNSQRTSFLPSRPPILGPVPSHITPPALPRTNIDTLTPSIDRFPQRDDTIRRNGQEIGSDPRPSPYNRNNPIINPPNVPYQSSHFDDEQWDDEPMPSSRRHKIPSNHPGSSAGAHASAFAGSWPDNSAFSHARAHNLAPRTNPVEFPQRTSAGRSLSRSMTMPSLPTFPPLPSMPAMPPMPRMPSMDLPSRTSQATSMSRSRLMPRMHSMPAMPPMPAMSSSMGTMPRSHRPMQRSNSFSSTSSSGSSSSASSFASSGGFHGGHSSGFTSSQSFASSGGNEPMHQIISTSWSTLDNPSRARNLWGKVGEQMHKLKNNRVVRAVQEAVEKTKNDAKSHIHSISHKTNVLAESVADKVKRRHHKHESVFSHRTGTTHSYVPSSSTIQTKPVTIPYQRVLPDMVGSYPNVPNVFPSSSASAATTASGSSASAHSNSHSHHISAHGLRRRFK